MGGDTGIWGKVGLVVVAAGSGSRFGGPKQLADLGGAPLLARTLAAFDGLPLAGRVVVLPAEFLAPGCVWETRLGPTLAEKWTTVAGGAERALSVRAGVEALGDGVEFAAVHDGARPFPPLAAAAAAARRVLESPTLAACIVASCVTDTIKRVEDSRILRTVDRSVLRRAETPQICRRAWLLEALVAEDAELARDEAEVLERLGHETAVELHDGLNPKVTVPLDLALAAALLAHGTGA